MKKTRKKKANNQNEKPYNREILSLILSNTYTNIYIYLHTLKHKYSFARRMQETKMQSDE